MDGKADVPPGCRQQRDEGDTEQAPRKRHVKSQREAALAPRGEVAMTLPGDHPRGECDRRGEQEEPWDGVVKHPQSLHRSPRSRLVRPQRRHSLRRSTTAVAAT